MAEIPEKDLGPHYLEKQTTEQSGVAYSDHDVDRQLVSEFSKEEEKNIMHRIDRRLVVTVGVMYCISLMDRTNLSVANIAG
jgi:hypothetical protein